MKMMIKCSKCEQIQFILEKHPAEKAKNIYQRKKI